MILLSANNAQTTLAAALTSGATTVQLATAAVLEQVLTALAGFGLVTDSTTA